MYIIDNFGQMVYAITEPYEEDLSLNITCVAKNGKSKDVSISYKLINYY